MANTVGLVVGAANCKRSICLMTAQTANTAAPALATDGVPAYPNNTAYGSATGAFYSVEFPDINTLTIASTATTSPTGIFTLWGYQAAHGVWFPIQVNAGAAVTGATGVQFAQTFGPGGSVVSALGHFDRLALQLTSVGGAGATFEAFLTTARKGNGN